MRVRARVGGALASGAFALALLLAAPSSFAEPTAADRALAAELFKEGRALMDAQRFDAACPKLEESQRLDAGGGTLLNVALCHEAIGRLASAWTEFRDALALARGANRPDRVELAVAHIAELEPRLSRLELAVAPSADVPGLEVLLDGTVVGRPGWGVALPVDPGKHEITARAPGYEPWSQRVEVAEPSSTRAVTIELGARVASPPPSADAAVTLPPLSSPRAPSVQRTAGFVVGAVGVVGLGLGAYFGIRAFQLHAKSNDQCKGGCTAEGVSSNRDSMIAADVSTVAFAAGLTTAGVGALLVLTAPRPSRASSMPSVLSVLSVTPAAFGAGAGLTARGSF
jgi:hypothetical protein